MYYLMPILAAAQPALPIAWGFATSAYQIEGAWKQGGKGPSVWDSWYNDPSRLGQPNGNIAIDHYHHVKSDIQYLGKLGASLYRFSVSWPRIFPDCSGSVNEEGVLFYSNMIDEILLNGATPVLTMYHWDTPQACEDQYGSWLNERIVKDFASYADLIFSRFGDRVKYFLTINEPAAECGWGYEQKFWPPGANKGISAKYLCQHLSNLAHGAVVQLARTKYPQLKLNFGMPLIVAYGEPLDPGSTLDIAAAERMMNFQVQWNWGPLTIGDYPEMLKNDPHEGPLLPVYTSAQKKTMIGTIDFVALNYYSSSYIKHSPGTYPGNFTGSSTRNGVPLGPVSGTSWQTVYGQGLRGMLSFLSRTFKMDIIVTECGVSVPNEQTMTPLQAIDDPFRQSFWQEHVLALTQSIQIDKIPVLGFLAWSLFDNFEWNTFDQRFGVIGIDFSGNLTRRVKNSAGYLSRYFSKSKSPFLLDMPSQATTRTSEAFLVEFSIIPFATLLFLM